MSANTLSLKGAGGRRGSAAEAVTRKTWTLPPVIVIVAIFIYPLALIVRQSFEDSSGLFTLQPYADVFSSPLFYWALVRTIEIAVASTIGCIVLGFVLSLIIAFVPFPGSRVLGRFIDAFLAFPSFLIALSFTFLYGSSGFFNFLLMDLFHLELPPLDFVYSPLGVILAEITFYTPFVMRSLLASFAHIDTAHIEVASSLGAKPLRIIRQVILPAAIPAVLAGGSLCLLLTLNEFGIVFFIGAKGVITLPMLIYSKAIQQFDYSAACVIAIVNIVLSLSLYSLYKMALTRAGGDHASLV